MVILKSRYRNIHRKCLSQIIYGGQDRSVLGSGRQRRAKQHMTPSAEEDLKN